MCIYIYIYIYIMYIYILNNKTLFSSFLHTPTYFHAIFVLHTLKAFLIY